MYITNSMHNAMTQKRHAYCCLAASLSDSETKGLSLTGLEPGSEMGLE